MLKKQEEVAEAEQAEFTESDSVDDALKNLASEKLESCWKSLAEHYKGQYSFHSTLLSATPSIKDGIIKFVVSNQVQFDDFTQRKQDIYDFLKNELGVKKLRIDLEINKSKSNVQDAYTDRDKYKKMVEKNPILKQLRDEFGLEPDF